VVVPAGQYWPAAHGVGVVEDGLAQALPAGHTAHVTLADGEHTDAVY
jgi:hypothetical protein